MFSSNKRTLLMVAPLLLLSACGEGWEAQKTDEIFPYGNKRTAGSGVVYVRAQMMPEKELKLEPVAEMPKEEVAPVKKAEPVAKPVLDAEEIFEDAQEKGSFSNKKRTMKAAEVAPVEEGQAEKLMKAEMTEPKASDVPAYAEETSQDVADAEIVAEQPKDIETPDVAVKDAPSEHEPVVAEAASEVEHVAEEVVEDVTAVSPQPVVEAEAEETIVADPSEGSTVDAVVDTGSVDESIATEKDQGWSDQIVAPKKDFIGYVPEGGEAVLSEIYSDGF